MENMETVVPKPALYEQLAEEAAELAHAALKYARVLREENPTAILGEDAYRNVIAEYTDIIHCARALRLNANEMQIQQKQERWKKRLEENGENTDEYRERLERVFGLA